MRTKVDNAKVSGMSEAWRNEFPLDRLVMRCCEIIECDTARISTPAGKKMFLVIGFNRSTKDDEGQWVKDGEPYDFDYVAEKTVASGETEDELIESALEYKRLCGMTIEEYLRELTA